jgi:hypothetical protein
VLNVPGLDRRRIDQDCMPFLYGLLADRPSFVLRSMPTTELFPTLVTGAWPSEHRIWHVSLKSEGSQPPGRWYDRLPDWLLTTAQCFKYLRDPAFELPAIPPARRRRFEMHRLKFDLRLTDQRLVRTIGGVPSVFGSLGDASRYRVIKRFEDLPGEVENFPDPNLRLEWIEFHAFDLASHWRLDQPRQMALYSRRLDQFLEKVHARCLAQDVPCWIVSDHGQELVVGSIDLVARLRHAGVPASEYDYFLAVGIARFWFHTSRAREAIQTILEEIPHLSLLTPDELRGHDVDLDGDLFGQFYAVADHGWIFFPHDFYHPLGNLYLGLKHQVMRPRVRDPRHRAYHGQLPDHPSEPGFVVSADPRFQAHVDEAAMIDFAPSLLTVLGEPIPGQMRGRVVCGLGEGDSDS